MRTGPRIDLTEGPIFKTLARLAVPITISMVLFTVYLPSLSIFFSWLMLKGFMEKLKS